MVHISYSDNDAMMGGVMITDKHVLTLYDDKLKAASLEDIKVVYRTKKVDPDDPNSIPSDADVAKVQQKIVSELSEKDQQLMILVLGKDSAVYHCARFSISICLQDGLLLV